MIFEYFWYAKSFACGTQAITIVKCLIAVEACVCVFCVGRIFFNVQMFVTLCCIICLCIDLALDVSWSDSCNSLYYRKLYSSKSLAGIGTTMSGVAMCCPILMLIATIRKEVASVHTDGRGGGVIHSFCRYFCSGNSGEQQFILDAQQRWRQQLGQRGGWWWVFRCLIFEFSFSSVKDSVSTPICLHPISYQSCVFVWCVCFGFWMFLEQEFPVAFFVTAILVSA